MFVAPHDWHTTFRDRDSLSLWPKELIPLLKKGSLPHPLTLYVVDISKRRLARPYTSNTACVYVCVCVRVSGGYGPLK